MFYILRAHLLPVSQLAFKNKTKLLSFKARLCLEPCHFAEQRPLAHMWQNVNISA